MKARTVIGFLGTRLDTGSSEDRWKKWRPTVALCQQKDFFVDRLILIHDRQSTKLAQQVMADIATISPATTVEPHVLNIRDPWDFGEVYAAMRGFTEKLTFDVESEDYFVNITTGTHVVQICWFLLAETRFVPARLVQLSPTANRRVDPSFVGTHSIIDLDLSKYDAIATRFQAEQQAATSFLKAGIETRDPGFNAMIERIERIATRSSAPILLMGATGAGKSQLARQIYQLKKSQHKLKGPFVEVNCATLRGDQAMSSLFGHVKGAFTGAQSERAGLLSSAHQGVLFMDEIGELGADEQAMCLRAIEEKRFLRVGADKETQVDFQLIAGTNRDLADDVRRGRFRDDLFARLNLWTFELPSLRDRKDDIEPNIEHELQKFAEREGHRVSFNREAREHYLAFALSQDAKWPSNFRDLSASVTRMATLAPAGRIDLETVTLEIEGLRRLWRSIPAQQNDAHPHAKAMLSPEVFAATDLFDLPQIDRVIAVCKESSGLSDAGRKLFSASRLQKSSSNDADRLRKYLQRFQLDFEMIRNSSGGWFCGVVEP